MQEQEILQQLASNGDQRVRVGIFDIDGVLRGKLMHLDKLRNAVKKGFGFCNVVFGWDINDLPYENTQLSGWHTGYPDALASLDPMTFRRIPWEDGLPFLLADFRADTNGFAEACPRSLLNRIAKQCQEAGFVPRFAGELEWFNFAENNRSFAEKGYRNPQPISKGMFGYSILRSADNQSFFQEIFDELLAFGIPIEGIHTETGDGVYEASMLHEEVMEAADRMALFKTSVKELSYRRGQMASFMAKWNADLPGCSGHIHQSLWSLNGSKNLFYNAESEAGMSKLMQHYLAGQLHCLPYLLPMYAPSINSYKRLTSGSWASVSVSWGIENRTTALRVIPGGEQSTRIEMRTPGADANPYLAMAASLASGLYGIRHQLPLDIKPTQGNEYENTGNRPLPSNLQEATQQMKQSSIPTELFGATFVDHFIRTREWEWEQFMQAVTDWELKRYFEII